ncbi:unnamed protein product [Linum trigynum]|uniref:Uncharacterized protein n=1 Tax=Linum trigynum TaxID=586398 RepID=A0AAV2DVP2_9ROSI
MMKLAYPSISAHFHQPLSIDLNCGQRSPNLSSGGVLGCRGFHIVPALSSHSVGRGLSSFHLGGSAWFLR